MEYVFLLLFFAALIALILACVSPRSLENIIPYARTRTQNVLLYTMLALVGFAGVGITAPDTTPQEAQTVEVPKEVQEATQTLKNAIDTTAPSTDDVQSVEEDTIYPVTRVIDGDTIEVLIDGEKKTVRYIGINTPETVHPSKPVECFGAEASARNKALVEGKNVRLVQDVSETDKYGRLLRYVYVDDVFVNLELVEGGYANASTYPPDVAQSEVFRLAEVDARENKRGLWGSACADGAPSTPAVTPTPAPRAGGQCTIKGNINAEGEKIYHMIGCQSYSRTVIDESAGEEWFCSEAEAQSAGWRKALNC